MKNIFFLTIYALSISFYGQTSEEYNNSGDAKFKSGDYRAALQDYNKAIGLNPKYAYLSLRLFYYSRNELILRV
ncbi:MAG: tetratricopeptide repeat protein [Bacteroidia bacterium]